MIARRRLKTLVEMQFLPCGFRFILNSSPDTDKLDSFGQEAVFASAGRFM